MIRKARLTLFLHDPDRNLAIIGSLHHIMSLLSQALLSRNDDRIGIDQAVRYLEREFGFPGKNGRRLINLPGGLPDDRFFGLVFWR